MSQVKTCSKKVKCIETGIIFNTVKEAAQYADVKSCTMSRHLHGHRLTCGKAKYHYEFVEEEFNRDKRFLQGGTTYEAE